MEILELPVPETMYMVGNGCSVGWTLNSGDGLFKIENARNPHLYSWTGEFNAGGEIKISLEVQVGVKIRSSLLRRPLPIR